MKIKAKIVVINCEATNPEGLQDKLEREGMEVEVVSDRKAALNRIAKQKPDLILLDNTISFNKVNSISFLTAAIPGLILPVWGGLCNCSSRRLDSCYNSRSGNLLQEKIPEVH